MFSIYATSSGQEINIQKSLITFSPNMTETQKAEVFSALNMPPKESLDVYLGLPAFIGRNKS